MILKLDVENKNFQDTHFKQSLILITTVTISYLLEKWKVHTHMLSHAGTIIAGILASSYWAAGLHYGSLLQRCRRNGTAPDTAVPNTCSDLAEDVA